MKLIIETIEKAIEHENWSIDYHQKALDGHKERLNQLNLELATLKVQLGEPTPGHEHNSPLYKN